MKLLSASLIWMATTFPAAWLYTERFREPAAVLALIGGILTLSILVRKDNLE